MDFSKTLLQKEDVPTFQTENFKFAQFFNTFILIEREGKLLFIDQHAADERIKYEAILDSFEKGEKIPIQPMLIPDTVELQPQDFELVQDNIDQFIRIGLDIEPFGANIIKINAIPSILNKFDFGKFIEEILQRELIDFDSQEILHSIVATMACHGSIRAGQKIHEAEIDQMIKQLFKCKKPYSCPHGRPIIWEMSKYEIEKKFKRTGFC